MRYLVTGAAGNLARQIVRRLVESEHEVLEFDVRPAAGIGAGYVQGDIADADLVERTVAEFRPERIVHMASLLSSSSEARPDLAWRVNADASYALMTIASRYNVDRLFYPSTSATYTGPLPDPLPEDHPQWPTNIYGVTKVAVERAGAYLAAKRAIDFRSVRLPMVISPFAPEAAVSAYASHAFGAAVRGERFVFPVTEAVGISTIYVADVVTGILRLLDAPREALGRPVYNLHAFAPTAGEIASAIRGRVPGFEYAFDPQPLNMQVLGPMPRVHADASARADWGWSPEYDLDRCADEMIAIARGATRTGGER